jgi:glycosyltransferase involved in cell wall biosynthesis
VTARGPASSGDRPQRVLLVTPGGVSARGGIGRLVAYMVDGWDQPGIELSVADSYGPGPKAIMPLYFAGTLLAILARALSGRLDLLHVNMSERLSVVRKGAVVYLGRVLGVPVVLHLHGAEFADHCRSLSPAARRQVIRMMRNADRVVVLGEYWRRFVTEELGLSPERVELLYNAVPGPAALAPRPPPAGPCRMLFMGAVSTRKGMDVLLEAAALLNDAGDWELTVAGNGDVERFQAAAEAAGLKERVRFLGWVDTARGRELLAQADLLVLPSRNEGLPMAILEAMSYGLPVVTTPVGSIRDAVADGVTGRLVPVGDPVALAAALKALIRDGDLRRRMGASARRRYEESFCLPSFNTNLAGIFRSVLAGAPARPKALARGAS